MNLVKSCVLFSLLSGSTAFAGIVGNLDTSGMTLYATGGDVTAYFEGQSAAYTDYLTLASPANSLGTIFVNHTAVPGQSVDLGYFAPGTELTFEMTVEDTGYSYFTGSAALNPDNQVHAAVGVWQADSLIPANGVYVGFEDLFNGPFNYNDLDFVFAGTTVTPPDTPEPWTWSLMASGLAILFLFRSGSKLVRR